MVRILLWELLKICSRLGDTYPSSRLVTVNNEWYVHLFPEIRVL
jgi:hypothetical protein